VLDAARSETRACPIFSTAWRVGAGAFVALGLHHARRLMLPLLVHRLYLSPGMFGFGRLATYDYFAHVERALTRRFADAGQRLEVHVVDVSPTASIRRRAVRLAELVAKTSDDDEGTIHLLGHSTGGLDARLVASPSARLPTAKENLAWLSRLRSVTTMSTPHYGTPLASFFATVSGQRMLYAVSALTFIGLSLGQPPLAAASALVVAIGRLDRTLGVELRLIDRTTDALLQALEPATSQEVRAYLDAIRRDQGAMIQLTPEAMDLFLAGVEDRPGVDYQCTCAQAPPPTPGTLARSLGGPWKAISTAIFTTMYGITARYDERYPCAAPEAGDEVDAAFVRAFGKTPGARANDGVVPVLSQVWGKVAWAGFADHLDVLGHFPGPVIARPFWSSLLKRRGTTDYARAATSNEGATRERDARRSQDAKGHEHAGGEGERATAGRGALPDADADVRHVDWLRSGAGFDVRSFDVLMDAVARGMLASC
jgi:triacylglycerol esterase/lipase EstA (alpha/beta hydrolase family)